MAVSQAHLTFVHRLVTNFYKQGFHQTTKRILWWYGDLYLEEAARMKDGHAQTMVANLSFVWWRVTGENSARDRALAIWIAKLDEGGESQLHAVSMLGYIALMDPTTPKSAIRAIIAQLRYARQQTADADRANRMADLAQKLGEQFFRRCGKNTKT